MLLSPNESVARYSRPMTHLLLPQRAVQQRQCICSARRGRPPKRKSEMAPATAEAPPTVEVQPMLEPQQTYFPVFIAHRGPEAKIQAVNLQGRLLREHGINAFVDETALGPGTPADREIKANLQVAKAAVVLFTAEFFKSTWCVKELEHVLELKQRGLQYIPVFFTQTVDQVYEEARKIHGNEFAAEVTRTTGIRFEGERHMDWDYTAQQVCQAVLKIRNIKKPVGSLVANLHVDCKSPWQRQQEELETLKVAAQDAASSAAAHDVWILCHGDTQYFAGKIKDNLEKMPLSVVRVVQPDPGATLEQHAAKLIAAEVAVVVFCNCFFVDGCKQLLRLMANYPRPYIAVCYTVTEKELRTTAVDAGGTDFAGKAVPPQCVVVAHQGGPVFRLERDTVREVRTHLQRMYPSAAAAAALAGASTAESRSQQRVWLNQPMSGPPYSNVSGVVHKSSAFDPADHQGANVELSSTLVGATSSVTGSGSILAVSELPAGFQAGPLLLEQSVRSWADAAAMADTAAAASTRVFAASAGGGLVARCQQGWGLILPPSAAGLPSMRCPAPILGVETASPNSNGVLLPLVVSWDGSVGRGSGAGSRTDSGNIGSTNDVGQHGAVVVGDGLQLHNPQLQYGAETGVMLPRTVLDSQKLLLLSLGSCSYWHSDTIPLLVVDAPPAVINELNKMVLAHPDIQVVERLYHVLLQPGGQLADWAEDAKNRQRGGPAEIIAASRATAAYHLLVLAIDQEAVLAAEWLLGMLARLQSAAPSSTSTLSVLQEQQRLASQGNGNQEMLWLLAKARGVAVQKAVSPLIMVTGSISWDDNDCVNLLQQTIAALQKEEHTAAAARADALSAEWSQIVNEPCMLQASCLDEMMTALGPAGDLAAAVLAGSLGDVRNLLLQESKSSQQQLDEALELAAMLGRVELLQLLLQHGADPLARGEAALAWAKRRIGEPQVLAALPHGLAAAAQSSDRGSTSGAGSGPAYNLAVAAWCLGLHEELSGLRAPGAPQPQLQSLQQFLSNTTAEQRTVANLLAQLQDQWPEMFVTAGPKPARSDQDSIQTPPVAVPTTESTKKGAEKPKQPAIELGDRTYVPASTKFPLDAAFPTGAPLIDCGPFWPPSAPEPLGKPLLQKQGQLPDGLPGLLATQSSSFIKHILHYIKHDYVTFFKNYAENGSSGSSQDKKEQLQQAVLGETVKYGELVQAVYDTLLTKDVYSPYFGNCVPGVMVAGQELSCPKVQKYTQLGEEASKYRVLTRIEADSGGYKLVVKKARNYVGFIAESEPDADGAVDIAIVFRGTITKGVQWDAKALQVRWRGGEQLISPPQIFLTSSPFQANIQLALATAIGTFLFISSSIGTSATHWLLGSLGALAHSFQPLETMAGRLTGLYNWEVMALQHGVIDHLGPTEVDPELLSQAGVVGIDVFLAAGIVSGIVAKPGDWLENVWKLLKAMVPWVAFGIYNFLDGLIGLPLHDPRVSYGVKEMYCNSLPYSEDEGGKLKVGTVAYSPRLTVYTTLVELLKSGKKIKSITITGHSLGGALASMCGFDLATAIQEALTGDSIALAGSRHLTHDIMKKLRANLPDDLAEKVEKGLKPITDMYREVRHTRAEFKAAIKAIRPKQEPVPAVAVVSFAAPRVGDYNYSLALGERSIMHPMKVLEPLLAPGYRKGHMWDKVAGFGRDWLTQTFKLPWYLVAKGQVAWKQLWKSPITPNQRKKGKKTDAAAAAAAAGVKVGMLRVVNAHDIVPDTPITLPLPPFSYVHGGYELMLNSYMVPYFKNGVFGQAIGARHNMEMYLHLLDHQRDPVMVNKSDDVLTEDKKIPAFWWDPVPNKGMTRDKDTGKWMRPQEDDTYTYLQLLDRPRNQMMINKSNSVLTDDQRMTRDSWQDPVLNKGLTRNKATGKKARP